MKIAVYSIAKNELREVAGWEEATRDADYRLVYDTGSTDGTDTELEKSSVTVVHGRIRPWRFDDARNAALAMIPEDIDICISLDMDERMHGKDCPIGKGWYEAIQNNWSPQTSMLRCLMISGGRTYYAYRIHARFGWRWKSPVHEVLLWRGQSGCVETLTEAMTIVHLPDAQKTRPPPTPLLAEAVAEAPQDARMALQYGWQLAVEGQVAQGMIELQRYLDLAPKTGIEAAFVHRLLASYDLANFEAHMGRAEAAWRSASNMIMLAEYHQSKEDWPACYTACQAAIARERMRPPEAAGHWGDDIRLISPWLHDTASAAAYKAWDFEAAYGHAVEAYRRSPDEGRKAIMLAIQKHIADGATLENMPKVVAPAASAEIVNFAKIA